MEDDGKPQKQNSIMEDDEDIIDKSENPDQKQSISQIGDNNNDNSLHTQELSNQNQDNKSITIKVSSQKKRNLKSIGQSQQAHRLSQSLISNTKLNKTISEGFADGNSNPNSKRTISPLKCSQKPQPTFQSYIVNPEPQDFQQTNPRSFALIHKGHISPEKNTISAPSVKTVCLNCNSVVDTYIEIINTQESALINKTNESRRIQMSNGQLSD